MTTCRKIVKIDEEKCSGCGECVPAYRATAVAARALAGATPPRQWRT